MVKEERGKKDRELGPVITRYFRYEVGLPPWRGQDPLSRIERGEFDYFCDSSPHYWEDWTKHGRDGIRA